MGAVGKGIGSKETERTEPLLLRQLCCLLWASSADSSKEAAGKKEMGFAEGFPDSSVDKEFAMQETPVRFLGWEDPLEKGQATHSSILRLPLWLSQ